MRTLLIGGHVYSPSERFATALLIEDSVVTWIGADTGAEVHRQDVDDVVDLHGDLVAPGFVHLANPAPSVEQGFIHGERAEIRVADRWVPEAWDRAAAGNLGGRAA